MATPFVYKGAKVYSGAYELDAVKSVSVAYAFDEVDITVLGDLCKHGIPGLCKVNFGLDGFGTMDGTDGTEDVVMAQLAVANQPLTVCPLTGAAGEAAKFTTGLGLSYNAGGAVGEAYAFQSAGIGQKYPVVHGKVFGTGAKTSTGTSSVYQLGAVGAAQKLYACLHVLAASGTNPTLDVIVESDDAEAFSSATTRATFTQKTEAGSQFVVPIAGPITDTWWRTTWTIGGTDTPTFSIVLAVGIF